LKPPFSGEVTAFHEILRAPFRGVTAKPVGDSGAEPGVVVSDEREAVLSPAAFVAKTLNV
jgi:hypothetical protein